MFLKERWHQPRERQNTLSDNRVPTTSLKSSWKWGPIHSLLGCLTPVCQSKFSRSILISKTALELLLMLCSDIFTLKMLMLSLNTVEMLNM